MDRSATSELSGARVESSEQASSSERLTRRGSTTLSFCIGFYCFLLFGNFQISLA